MTVTSRPAIALFGVIATLSLAPAAGAVNPAALDRDYQLGDDGVENAVLGETVGTNFMDGGGNNFTADSAGATVPTFQDLQVFGDPEYVDVADRPGIASGLGAEFDGVGDYLRGSNLNLPSTSQASLGYDDDPGEAPTNNPGPLNYAGIANRFLQFWVKPDSASQLATQSLVMDTNQHGVRIVDGKWSMRYAGSDFDSDANVPFDQWSHVMLARPFGAGGGSRLYINGEAVIAAPDGYDGGAVEELVIGSTTGRDELNEFNGGTGEFFHGVIDNLTMSIVGDNSSDPGPPPGQDFGEFEFFTDNEYVDQIYAFDLLDLNRDGAAATGGDVAAFVAGWRSPQLINGVQVGDLNSLANGDVNFDGTTNLLDWSIINAANPTLGAAIGQALAGAGVPEPGAAGLLVLSAILAVWSRSTCTRRRH